ncbi:MAG: hypothetical protein ACEPOW_06765 [Bacteroidales bacterium]
MRNNVWKSLLLVTVVLSTISFTLSCSKDNDTIVSKPSTEVKSNSTEVFSIEDEVGPFGQEVMWIPTNLSDQDLAGFIGCFVVDFLVVDRNTIELIRVEDAYRVDHIEGIPNNGDPSNKHKEKSFENSREGAQEAGKYSAEIMKDGGCVKMWKAKNKDGVKEVHVKEIDC